MSRRGDENWTLKETPADFKVSCRHTIELLKRKCLSGRCAISGIRVVSVERYYECRARARLTAVHKADATVQSRYEKTMEFSKKWRDSEVPSNIRSKSCIPAVTIRFSPLVSDRFDFARLDEIPESFSARSTLKSGIVNFFNWAVAELQGKHSSYIAGYKADIEIGLYHAADRVVVSKDGHDQVFWVDSSADEIWSQSETGEIHRVRAGRVYDVGTWFFIGSFVLGVLGFWGLSFVCNMITPPPVTPMAVLAFVSAAFLPFFSAFIRGYAARIIMAITVALSAWILVPWIGDAWDITTNATLCTFFIMKDWADAPIGATYVASVTVLTLLSFAAMPSLAIKLNAGRVVAIICGLLFSAAVSPWPQELYALREIPPEILRGVTAIMTAFALAVVGVSGWAFSGGIVPGQGMSQLSQKIMDAKSRSGIWLTFAAIVVLMAIGCQIWLVV